MRLSKFRIQNYKSITDSGYCTFASDLTVLIGTNESGKTAILEALKYFNKDILQVPEDALRLDGSANEPLVEICFQLKRDEISEIREAAGVKFTDKAFDFLMADGLTVIKDSRGQYHLTEECTKYLFADDASKGPIKNIKMAKDKLSQLLNVPHFPSIDYGSGDERIQKETKEFIRVVKSYLPSVKDEEEQMEIVETIRSIIKESVKLTAAATESQKYEDSDRKAQKKNLIAAFIRLFVERMPNFVFFGEFSDILPFEIPISNLKNNQAVLDFAKISGLDLDYLMKTHDTQRRINYLNKYSTNISGNFHEYWKQDQIELAVKSEGDKLIFGAKENGKTDFFKIAQRSKGFQWFLSFYLRINAHKSDNSFIIIDEPATYLHAKAQQEILKVLKNEMAADSQVIFATHCPYLIDPKRLDRLRLVLKDEQSGTVLSGDIHNLAYKDSMTPALTAMAYEQTHLALKAGKQNVIVGGVQDYYFFNALKSYITDLKLDDIHLMPAADHQKTEELVSLMVSYDLDFVVLLNHDDDSYDIAQKLKAKFGFGDERITFIFEQADYFTEDLFAFEDFNGYVLADEVNKDLKISNSVFMKNNLINKALFAREFYKRVEERKDEIALSEQTVASFRNIFEKILKKFDALKGVVEEADQDEDEEEQGALHQGGKKRRSLFAFLNKRII